jgi:hypothetical protein
MRSSWSLITAALLILAVNSSMSSMSSMAARPMPPAKKPEVAIRQVLDAQAKAWNEGNLEEFMKSYWQSERLTFFSGARQLRGWEATLERYRKTYQADGREMGHLDFSDVSIEMLGPAGALVRGRYHLKFKDGREATGIYTLALRRFSDGWKIIHDHTSADN